MCKRQARPRSGVLVAFAFMGTSALPLLKIGQGQFGVGITFPPIQRCEATATGPDPNYFSLIKSSNNPDLKD